MLHITETTDIRTIVPLPVPSRSDEQETLASPIDTDNPLSLFALLAHPDFQEGMAFGREAYYDITYEGMLTEEQMMCLVEEELSRRVCQREARQAQVLHLEPVPYLMRLGMVMGVISESLAPSTEEDE